MHEIHAIPTCHKCQGKKDRGDDGENFHNSVLPNIDLCLKQFPYLHSILPQHLRLILQAVDPFLYQVEQFQTIFFKILIFIFFKFADHIFQLRVVMDPAGNLLPQSGHVKVEVIHDPG